jgi:rhomboid protease GluP
MNENTRDLIINILITKYNYSVFEYYKVNSEKSLWGVKGNTDFGEQLIVFGSINEVADLKDSIHRYYGAMLRDKVTFTYILFSDGKLNTEIINNLKDYINSLCDNSALIMVNEPESVVSYFDYEVSETAEAVQSILIKVKNSKSNKEKNNIMTVTNIIIFSNIVMYILTAYLSGNIFDSDARVLRYLGAKHNGLIQQGEYYRLVTAMFLHGGILHIGLNMYALRSIGPLIEKMYGKIKFLIIYFVSGITSSLFSYFFSPAISVGASGAIFGLMGAAVILGITMSKKIGREFLNSILQVVLVNLFLGFNLSNIDNFGHLGGLIGGLIITSLFYIKQKNKVKNF